MTGKDSPGVIALPPLILAIALVIALLLDHLLPLDFLPAAFHWATLVTGLIIAALGLGLAAWGIATFRAAGTNVEPFKPALVLVERGPYRFTRNPMYLGLQLELIAMSLIFSIDWGLPMMVPLFVTLHFGVVLREERYLAAKFGAPYQAFLDRTRRWI